MVAEGRVFFLFFTLGSRRCRLCFGGERSGCSRGVVAVEARLMMLLDERLPTSIAATKKMCEAVARAGAARGGAIERNPRFVLGDGGDDLNRVGHRQADRYGTVREALQGDWLSNRVPNAREGGRLQGGYHCGGRRWKSRE